MDPKSARGLTAVVLPLLVGCQASPAGEPASVTASVSAPVFAAASAPAPVSAPASAPASASCPAGMEPIPGGTSQPRKRRGARVAVAPFCLDRTEVTLAAYKDCVRAGKCSPECLEKRQCSAAPTRTAWGDVAEDARSSAYCNGDREDRQDHPINCVSLEEASAFCAAYGKRLPTADEWEWAARGAEAALLFPWGSALPDAQVCWSPYHRRHNGTCPAGGTPGDRTPQGVLDLGGNVAEWVQPPEIGGRRVPMAFGASWYAVDDGYVAAALSGVEVPSERNETLGFRCAR